jgi:hypothetical protein
VSESGDCVSGCGDTEACVQGSCVPRLDAPAYHDIPAGVGLFADLVHRSDDSMVLSYYDHERGELVVATSNGTGFVPVASDDDPELDAGQWISTAVDADDVVHIAYQDASGDRLLHARFDDGELSLPTIVDDGVRDGDDRTHPVGASASIAIKGDRQPVIVYQDALTADLITSSLEGSSWTRSELRTGVRLDGFFIDLTRSGNDMVMSHYFYDRGVFPPGELEIATLP